MPADDVFHGFHLRVSRLFLSLFTQLRIPLQSMVRDISFHAGVTLSSMPPSVYMTSLTPSQANSGIVDEGLVTSQKAYNAQTVLPFLESHTSSLFVQDPSSLRTDQEITFAFNGMTSGKNDTIKTFSRLALQHPVLTLRRFLYEASSNPGIQGALAACLASLSSWARARSRCYTYASLLVLLVKVYITYIIYLFV